MQKIKKVFIITSAGRRIDKFIFSAQFLLQNTFKFKHLKSKIPNTTNLREIQNSKNNSM